MFNSKKESTNTPSSTKESSSGGINSLAIATNITGDVSAEKDIRLDGTLKGNLRCGGKVILGAKGKIIGEIDCENAVIEGVIEGIIRVKDTLQVKETGNIKADIKCTRIVVHNGAAIYGKCEAGGQTISAKSIPQNKKA